MGNHEVARIGKLVGVFAVLGLGIGIGALMVLGVMGVFSDSADIGSAFAAAFVLVAVLVFAILSGLVVATITSGHVARKARSRAQAAGLGAISAALGHVALIATLVITLFVGMAMLANQTEPTSTGNGSNDDSGPVDYAPYFKSLFGIVPAGIVGGATAALLWEPARSFTMTRGPATGPDGIESPAT